MKIKYSQVFELTVGGLSNAEVARQIMLDRGCGVALRGNIDFRDHMRFLQEETIIRYCALSGIELGAKSRMVSTEWVFSRHEEEGFYLVPQETAIVHALALAPEKTMVINSLSEEKFFGPRKWLTFASERIFLPQIGPVFLDVNSKTGKVGTTLSGPGTLHHATTYWVSAMHPW